jgi:hypothetical protein
MMNYWEPIAFLSVEVDTSDRVYDDFSRLLFQYVNREASLCLTQYRKNRINFVFFGLPTMLTLRGQWGWFWRKIRSWGFLYRVICHLGRLYHYLVLFVRDVLFHFYILPLFFLLGVLSKWNMRGFYLRVLSDFLASHSFSVTLFTLGVRPFYSPVNKHHHIKSPTSLFWSETFSLDSRLFPLLTYKVLDFDIEKRGGIYVKLYVDQTDRSLKVGKINFCRGTEFRRVKIFQSPYDLFSLLGWIWLSFS